MEAKTIQIHPYGGYFAEMEDGKVLFAKNQRQIEQKVADYIKENIDED